MRRTAALIVGGGPAGSAAAITLARRGVRPELIERTTGAHDMVCGGFLGWDALHALERLGVDAAALGARPIRRLRLVGAGRTVETDLPRQAAGLSRRTLDAALLARAREEGAEVHRGRAVRAADAETRTIRLDDGEEIAAEALLLATGKHELRGLARPLEGWRATPSAGVRLALPPSPALHRALHEVIELHLFDHGYAGLLLQEDGSTNLCISTAPRRLSAAGGVEGLIAELCVKSPLLGERIGGAAWKYEAVAGVPYGWRARGTAAGLFRIGDQAAVIASLAGDGVAIALTSGTGAAEALLSGGPKAAPEWQKRFSGRAALPLGAAEALRGAAERSAPRATLMRLLQSAPGLASLAARLTRIA